MNITVKKDIKDKDIGNLLVSAFEGGSNYWYMIEKEILPTEWTYREFTNSGTKGNHYPHEVAMNKGGALLISSMEDEEKGHMRLDLEVIQKGLGVMADKFPKHFADIISDDTDATTGDVFLQCCLFGDVIYG